MKPLREFAAEILDRAAQLMQKHKQADPYEDLPLMVAYVPAGTDQVNLIVPVLPEDPLDPQQILYVSLEAAYDQLGPPRVIGHTADAWMGTVDAEPNNYRRGDIAKQKGSTEALVTSVYYRHDDDSVQALSRLQPYHYEHDVLIFDEVRDTDSLVDGAPGGAFDDIIRHTFQKGRN